MDPKVLKRIEVEEEGIRLISLVFMIDLYTDKRLSEVGAAALATFKRYRQIVGDDALRFYATATMSKHAKVNKRALGMLDTWLEPGAKLGDVVSMEYHDGPEYNHAPTSTAFAMSGSEDQEEDEERPAATLVRLSLPYAWGEDTPDKAQALTEELWSLLPWRSGSAGYALETTRYLQEAAYEAAYAVSMRHPGIDIAYTVNDAIMAGFTHLRRIGWLTLLDKAFAKELGGLDSLRKSVDGAGVTVTKLGHGVMLKAGDRPAIGDVNRKDKLPAYRAVYRAVEPLLMDFDDAPWLELGGDSEACTEAWLKRFGT